MKRLSSECMSLCAWACGKQKWKGQGAVGCQNGILSGAAVIIFR